MKGNLEGFATVQYGYFIGMCAFTFDYFRRNKD
jgi:hypothetical protein